MEPSRTFVPAHKRHDNAPAHVVRLAKDMLRSMRIHTDLAPCDCHVFGLLWKPWSAIFSERTMTRRPRWCSVSSRSRACRGNHLLMIQRCNTLIDYDHSSCGHSTVCCSEQSQNMFHLNKRHWPCHRPVKYFLSLTDPVTKLLVGGSRDRSPVVSLGIFSVAIDGTMCPGVDSASKNEYQKTPGGKDGRCVRVTTLPP